jgi:hypothetical protein
MKVANNAKPAWVIGTIEYVYAKVNKGYLMANKSLPLQGEK